MYSALIWCMWLKDKVMGQWFLKTDKASISTGRLSGDLWRGSTSHERLKTGALSQRITLICKRVLPVSTPGNWSIYCLIVLPRMIPQVINWHVYSCTMRHLCHYNKYNSRFQNNNAIWFEMRNGIAMDNSLNLTCVESVIWRFVHYKNTFTWFARPLAWTSLQIKILQKCFYDIHELLVSFSRLIFATRAMGCLVFTIKFTDQRIYHTPRATLIHLLCQHQSE